MSIDPLTYRAVCYARRVVANKFISYKRKKPGKLPAKKTTERWLLEAWDLAYARIVQDTRSSFPWDYSHRALAWRAVLEKQFADPRFVRPGLLDTIVDLVATSLHTAGRSSSTTQSYVRRCVRSAWRQSCDTNLKEVFPLYYERDIVYTMIQDRVAIVLNRTVSDEGCAIEEAEATSEPELLGSILDRVVPEQLEFLFH